jgi:sec-independent protein translocase protein TatB
VLGVNGWEFLVLAVIALVVVGPDKLPRYAADAARFIRQVRNMARQAQDDVREHLGPEFADIDVRDLDPRRFVQKHLLEDDDLRFSFDDDPRDDDVPAARSDRHDRDESRSGSTPRKHSGSGGSTSGGSTRIDLVKDAPPPYDNDAT